MGVICGISRPVDDVTAGSIGTFEFIFLAFGYPFGAIRA
ncbi:hypothetical protein PTD2_07504 [Pseudoalteromonas tunicata D2]|uniref:Uncharacterized protein n=1 Tax=Pseudoalteromonas tunicata D2 TaxID=87626 RepID=A4C8F6_9GAMM|nr:hypothetical protein PTD2_07504 [Pseudoalteromonas tunicata D2]